jgi:predicted lipid-binding transport protein (Tim44 family)
LYTGRHKEIESAIQRKDPNFATDEFLSQFQIAFHAIQHAWQNQTMNYIQAFVSDGIYERFSLQIQEQKDLGYRNFMDQIEIRDTLFADLHTDSFFQTLTVQVNASAIQYRVHKDTDQFISGFKIQEEVH